jgi:hypothetical protein
MCGVGLLYGPCRAGGGWLGASGAIECIVQQTQNGIDRFGQRPPSLGYSIAELSDLCCGRVCKSRIEFPSGALRPQLLCVVFPATARNGGDDDDEREDDPTTAPKFLSWDPQAQAAALARIEIPTTTNAHSLIWICPLSPPFYRGTRLVEPALATQAASDTAGCCGTIRRRGEAGDPDPSF